MSRFDETIKKMQDITSDIKEKADLKMEDLDDESKAKIKTVADKTIDVINEAAFKLKSAMDKIEGEEDLNEFLDRVESKCESAKRYAFDKFEEIAPKQEEYVNIKDETEGRSTMERFMDNENFRNASRFIGNLKDGLVDIYNSPSVQLKINEAKLAALKMADKGLDTLKEALNKNNEEEQTNKKG